MRRQIILIFLVLMVASVGLAGYPEDYRGDQLPGGCTNIEARVTGWYDANAWGQVDPTGHYAYFGTLCVDGGVAVLDLTEYGYRHCRQPAWGSPGNPPICYAWYIGDWWWDRHVLAYDGGVYISGILTQADDGTHVFLFDALTYSANEGTSRFVQGGFLHSSLWYTDDDRYTRTTWIVEPRKTQYLNLLRGASWRLLLP